MAEQGGITELQMLQTEIAVLKRMLKGIEKAGNTDTVNPSIVEAINNAASLDCFMNTCNAPNPYHSSAPSTAAADGCCVLA